MAKTMQDLFLLELRDIYHAEKQLTRALPKMAKAASNPELRKAFETHLEETRGQVDRLETVFTTLDVRTRAKPCEAMEGLIEEAKEILEEGLEPEVLDAALIAAAQKVEHYEIASYGTMVAYAKILGQTEIVRLLQQTLDEEKNADSLLNNLALSGVNEEAVQAAE